MRHRFSLPDPIEVPSATLTLSITHALGLDIRARVLAGRRVQNRKTSLLRVNPEIARHDLDDGLYPAFLSLPVQVPNARIHVSWMNAVHRDMLQLIVLQEAELEFSEPDLKP